MKELREKIIDVILRDFDALKNNNAEVLADKIIALLPKRVEVTPEDVDEGVGHILDCTCDTCLKAIATWVNGLMLSKQVEITGEMINAQLYRLNINGVSNDKCQSLANWFNNLGKEKEG